MSPVVAVIAAGSMAVGVCVGMAAAYVTTTGLIELYVRHSKWKDYSLPLFPWVRGPNMMG